MHDIDINKEPPSREFLEKHIEADHFLDYVSTRSPVWKERPLPKSKAARTTRPAFMRCSKPISLTFYAFRR